MRPTLLLHRFPTGVPAIGTALLVSDGERLRALDYAGYEARMEQLLRRRCGAPPRLVEAADRAGFCAALAAYVAGDLGALDGIAVDTGGTPFQRRIWEALRGIAPGRTMSYGALAAQLGLPRSSRAVGRANAMNPVAIIVPCHRLIGAGGGLTGYAGGLQRKHWLLRHEGAAVTAPSPAGNAAAG